MRYIRGFLIKKAPILWLRNRTTENRKGKKARNIKEKRQSKNFNTVSKQLVVLHSSANDKKLYIIVHVKNLQTLCLRVFFRS